LVAAGFGIPDFALVRFEGGDEGDCIVTTSTTTSTSTTVISTIVTSTTAILTSTTMSTTSTLPTAHPCENASCFVRGALSDPICAGILVPPAIASKLERAAVTAEQAATAVGKAQRKLHKRARRILTSANLNAKRVSRGKRPKLDPACAEIIRTAIASAKEALTARQ
jgi:hypothetical protein